MKKHQLLKLLLFLVQRPAPVYDMKIVSSTNSALVSWKLRPGSLSSYVTQVRISIYKNGRWFPKRTIFRTTQFHITSLVQNTRYSVEIETLDGSLQTSRRVLKVFQTKEVAGKNWSILMYDIGFFVFVFIYRFTKFVNVKHFFLLLQ